MGNCAIIKGINQEIGIYVHWNGGYDSVKAFCQYCKLKGYRSPEQDSYGLARMCQVIGNFFGGGLFLGLKKVPRYLLPSEVDGWCLDNGFYEIKNWEIVNHMNPTPVTLDMEDKGNYDLIEFLETINKKMPADEQLPVEIFRSKEVPASELKIGDKVFLQGINESYEEYRVVGVGKDEVVNGHNVKGIPYVNKYETNGRYNLNGNNYLMNYVSKEERMVRIVTNDQ